MASASPPPNSTPSRVPPPSNASPPSPSTVSRPPTTTAPPLQNSPPPPQSPTRSPPQPSANPPGSSTPSTQSPPPATPTPPQQPVASPPPASPPVSPPPSPPSNPSSPPAPPQSNPSPPPPAPKPSPVPNSPPPSQSPPAESPKNLPPSPSSGSNSSSPPPASQPTPSPPSNSTHRPSVPPVKRLAPPPSQVPRSSDSSGIVVAAVAIVIAVGIIVLILIGLAVWCLRKRKRKLARPNGVYVMPSSIGFSPRSDSFLIKTDSSAPIVGSSSGSEVSSPKDPGGLGNSRGWFSYEELVKATNGFSEHNLLGEGGFGAVYKGCLPDGREVAVKQLNIGGGQGEREFKAEVEIISRVHHRHLVSLVGYCIFENRRLLVYDYVPNNTLHLHLHGRPVLDWAKRIKIAAGAARGIAYLHEDCHPRIIHRDIKSSNILLDNNFEAQVSDFGLAKLALDSNTHVTTRVMGTFGYMAPEYATSGKLTEKSDVFSFGVVLLELITGRKPVDTTRPLGDESLVEWARPLLGHALDTKEFESLADPRLGGNYVESEMVRMVEAAAACVRHLAAKRPRMGQIVRAFDSLDTADLSNGMRVGESEVFNAGQQSEGIRWFRRIAFGSQNYGTDYFDEYEHSKSEFI